MPGEDVAFGVPAAAYPVLAHESYHHRHFAERGWACRLNKDGLPVWIPPKWIDPLQRPILNHRITINNWDLQDTLDLDGDSDPDDSDDPDPPGQPRPPG